MMARRNDVGGLKLGTCLCMFCSFPDSCVIVVPDGAGARKKKEEKKINVGETPNLSKPY